MKHYLSTEDENGVFDHEEISIAEFKLLTDVLHSIRIMKHQASIETIDSMKERLKL